MDNAIHRINHSIILLNWSILKRSILSGPIFATRTTKMDRSRTDFTDLCFCKDIQREHFGVK